VEKPVACVHPKLLVQITHSTRVELYGQYRACGVSTSPLSASRKVSNGGICTWSGPSA
jgi:hypothetical protein